MTGDDKYELAAQGEVRLSLVRMDGSFYEYASVEVLCVGLGHCGKRVGIAWEVRKEVCRGTKDV